MRQPSVMLVLFSIATIIACLATISAAMSWLIVETDSWSTIAAAFILPLPMSLAILQYHGTFRRNRTCAVWSGGLLLIIASQPLVMFLMNMTDVPLLIVIIAFATGVYLNLSWAWQLVPSATSERSATERWQYSIRELLVGMTSIAFVVALTSYSVRSTHSQLWEHRDNDSARRDVPLSATDVSYRAGPNGTFAYEFTVDETAFITWFDSKIDRSESAVQNRSLQPITGRFSIPRYTFFANDSTGPKVVTITTGIFYDGRKGGRHVSVAFDRTTGRAYYYSDVQK